MKMTLYQVSIHFYALCLFMSLSDFSYCETFLRSVICLSVVCREWRIYVFCLNYSTDLGVVWQVTESIETLRHCVSWCPWLPGEGGFGSQTISKNMQLEIAAKP